VYRLVIPWRRGRLIGIPAGRGDEPVAAARGRRFGIVIWCRPRRKWVRPIVTGIGKKSKAVVDVAAEVVAEAQ
jgi:hypothetical protein